MSDKECKQDELNLYKKKVGRYILKFNTEKHSVSADILGRALLAYQDTIRQITKNSEGVVETLVEVDGLTKGCVEVAFAMTSKQIDDDDSKQAEMIGDVRALVGFYRFLHGKAIKKCDDGGDKELIVTNMEGATLHVNRKVFAAYHDCSDAPFGDATAYAADDITSVQLLSAADRKEEVRIDRADFGSFEKPLLKITDTRKEETVEERSLKLVTVQLSAPRNQWTFLMDGVKISANIVDESFLSKMAAIQEQFSQGDVIRAKVRITREFDNIAKDYKVRSYAVEKVVELVHRPKPKEGDDLLTGKEADVKGESA